MRRAVKAGRTLLIDGPASAMLVSGEASALGAPITVGKQVVVRYGKRIPFRASRDSEFELSLGNSASISEVEGDTIPELWWRTIEGIISSGRPNSVLVIGGVDAGKTSFCTCLANGAIKEGWKVAVIDGDPGQSDIGPPGTVGLCCLENYVVDLFETCPASLIFLGVITPSRALNAVIEAVISLTERASRMGVDLTIINTDGWVDGDEAVNYKVRLIEGVAPNVVVGIQGEGELNPILSKVDGDRAIAINKPDAVKRRNREVRRSLRELAYKRYLRRAKVRTYPIRWVKLEGGFMSLLEDETLIGFYTEGGELDKLHRLNPIYMEETSGRVLLIIDENQVVSKEQMRRIESSTGKSVTLVRGRCGSGPLVGLKDSDGNLMGIGIILGVDLKKNVVKLYTPVEGVISTVHVGQLVLDKMGREVEVICGHGGGLRDRAY